MPRRCRSARPAGLHQAHETEGVDREHDPEHGVRDQEPLGEEQREPVRRDPEEHRTAPAARTARPRSRAPTSRASRRRRCARAGGSPRATCAEPGTRKFSPTSHHPRRVITARDEASGYRIGRSSTGGAADGRAVGRGGAIVLMRDSSSCRILRERLDSGVAHRPLDEVRDWTDRSESGPEECSGAEPTVSAVTRPG